MIRSRSLYWFWQETQRGAYTSMIDVFLGLFTNLKKEFSVSSVQ